MFDKRTLLAAGVVAILAGLSGCVLDGFRSSKHPFDDAPIYPYADPSVREFLRDTSARDIRWAEADRWIRYHREENDRVWGRDAALPSGAAFPTGIRKPQRAEMFTDLLYGQAR